MMFRKSIMIISSPFKYFLATIMWLTNPVLGGQSYIKGIYDLNNNGVREVLILRSGQPGIMLIELTNSSISDTLWSYTLPDGRQFTDALVMDINKNGQPDLIATAALQPKNGDRNWLFVFPGTNMGFENTPAVVNDKGLNIDNLRPINLSKVEGPPGLLSVSFGTPARKTLVFHPEITDAGITIDRGRIISDSLVRNGFGHMYSGSFSSGGRHYLAQFSTELNTLKVSVFDVDKDYQNIITEVLQLGNARGVIAQGIQSFNSGMDKQGLGLLIPFATGPVKLLNVNEDKLEFIDSDFFSKDLFPKLINPSESELLDLVNYRVQSGFYHVIQPHANFMREDREPKTMYRPKILSGPTLSDYLNEVGVGKKSVPTEKIDIPKINDDMHSSDWAADAGIEIEKIDSNIVMEGTAGDSSKIVAVPDTDNEILAFSETVKKALIPKKSEADQQITSENENSLIDLYYILVMTPATVTKDRFIFDGEAPFGVAVNQVPSMGDPTHFQHSVSANLAHLRHGNEYDFAYTLKENITDSVTTLVMVHDMQTNIVFLSVSPIQDSLSQSYQPEAFDPKLFEFPDYFFEGFPISLGMDFTDKLIRFSFNDQSDSSLYQGIYLSATTPSRPAQSLAVFLDEGILQAIRGEVKVRENGSKKITTEFDISGFVEPTVMFSRLVQEDFPDSLKRRLLQGESMEEPLFGPDGRLPKVIHERRLPDAQFGQQNPPIPVNPLKGIFPEGQGVTTQTKASAESPTPQPQEPSEKPVSPETPITEPSKPDTPSDTLKLEDAKSIPSNKIENVEPKKLQLESTTSTPSNTIDSGDNN